MPLAEHTARRLQNVLGTVVVSLQELQGAAECAPPCSLSRLEDDRQVDWLVLYRDACTTRTSLDYSCKPSKAV